MSKLIDVKKQTENKWLNLYEAKFESLDGKVLTYYFASRNNCEDLRINGGTKIDAVRVVPYFIDENGEINIVLIREFRYPINDYLYAVPAGIIDDEESPMTAARREVKEETGYSVKKIELTEMPAYSSPGLTDESIICFEAEVKNKNEQNLDESEEIEVLTVKLPQIDEFLNNHVFGLQSRLQLRSFYYKKMLEKLQIKE